MRSLRKNRATKQELSDKVNAYVFYPGRDRRNVFRLDNKGEISKRLARPRLNLYLEN